MMTTNDKVIPMGYFTDGKKAKILSIDGGGVRGIISICILKELESKLHGPIQDHFNCITGTSVGGIIAAILSIKDENGNFKYDAHYLYDNFAQFAKEIFSNDWFGGSWNFFSFGGTVGAKYHRDNLDEALQRELGETTLSETKLPIIIHALELYPIKPTAFSTFHALENNKEDYKLYDVAGATASAPTYLDPKHLDNKTFVDGGLYANDPSVAAAIEVLNFLPKLETEDLFVLSVGTGLETDGFQYSGNNGIFGWLFSKENIIDLTLDATQRFNHEVAKTGFKGHYFKLQPELNHELPSLDDSSDKNLEYLKQIGEAYAKEYLDAHPDIIVVITSTEGVDLIALADDMAQELLQEQVENTELVA